MRQVMGVFRGSVFRVQERKAGLDADHHTAQQYSRKKLACDFRNRMLRLLNTEPLNTEHSKHLLIPIPNRNCLTHLVKQSACKEVSSFNQKKLSYHLHIFIHQTFGTSQLFLFFFHSRVSQFHDNLICVV